MAIDGTAVCAGSWTSPRPGTLGAFAPSTALSHNRVRPLCGPYATQSETPKESVAPCPRELTGENSPHYTYQPAKMKTDRVLVKYFCRWYCCGNRCPRSAQIDSPKGCDSWKEEIELFGCSVVRCLGNAAESVEQALDAMPDRYDRMAAAPREFRAGDAFELELQSVAPVLRKKAIPCAGSCRETAGARYRRGNRSSLTSVSRTAVGVPSVSSRKDLCDSRIAHRNALRRIFRAMVKPRCEWRERSSLE